MLITLCFSLKWPDFFIVLLIINIVINIFIRKKEFTNRIIANKKKIFKKHVEKIDIYL